MKLRFKVNQGEALRRGIDCPKSIVTVEVDPADLPQDERNLIADRLDGIDVCRLGFDGKPASSTGNPLHLEANGPTFEDLMAAIAADDPKLKKETFDARMAMARGSAAKADGPPKA